MYTHGKWKCTHTTHTHTYMYTYTHRVFDLTQLSHRHLDWSLPALTAEFHHDNSRQGPLLPPLLVTTAPSPPPRMEHVSTATCSWCHSHVCVCWYYCIVPGKHPKLRVGSCTEEVLEWFNIPFPLRCNAFPWRHIWGASDGLLYQILHCYMCIYGNEALCSDNCPFMYRRNTELSGRWSRTLSIGLFNSGTCSLNFGRHLDFTKNPCMMTMWAS